MLQRIGIQDAATTARNPQANAVCERMHQTVANILRTLTHLRTPTTRAQAMEMVDDALATAMHAMRCAVHRALGISPGALAFRRDMYLDLPIVTDLLLIQQKRQALIDENLRRENMKRRSFDFRVGQRVLIKSVDPRKLDPRAHGPYSISQVFTNGTINVQIAPHVVERINIRRVIPYRA